MSSKQHQKLSYARFRWNGDAAQFHRFYANPPVKTAVKTSQSLWTRTAEIIIKTASEAQSCWIPLEWRYAAVSLFLVIRLDSGEDCGEDCGRSQVSDADCRNHHQNSIRSSVMLDSAGMALCRSFIVSS